MGDTLRVLVDVDNHVDHLFWSQPLKLLSKARALCGHPGKIDGYRYSWAQGYWGTSGRMTPATPCIECLMALLGE